MKANKNAPLRSRGRHQRQDGLLKVQNDFGLRILVVGDEPERAGTISLLRLDGHVVQVAPDGPSALRAAQTHAPDVVLLDLSLLGTDWWQVARQLWVQQTYRKPLMIAVGECLQEVERCRSPEVEVHLHLRKPVDSAFLRKLLRRFQAILLPVESLPGRDTRPRSGSRGHCSGPA